MKRDVVGGYLLTYFGGLGNFRGTGRVEKFSWVGLVEKFQGGWDFLERGWNIFWRGWNIFWRGWEFFERGWDFFGRVWEISGGGGWEIIFVKFSGGIERFSGRIENFLFGGGGWHFFTRGWNFSGRGWDLARVFEVVSVMVKQFSGKGRRLNFIFSHFLEN